jgi:hypothetical protein
LRLSKNDGTATQEVIMSEPFIYIGSYQVKPGHLEEARHRLRDVSALVEEQDRGYGPSTSTSIRLASGSSASRFTPTPSRWLPTWR